MSEKVVFEVVVELEKAKRLVTLLRLAAWKEFRLRMKSGRLEDALNERLLRDLAMEFQRAINTYNKEVPK